MEWLTPPATWVQRALASLTWVGDDCRLVLLLPTWPLSPAPQANSTPSSLRIASECRLPAATADQLAVPTWVGTPTLAPVVPLPSWP